MSAPPLPAEMGGGTGKRHPRDSGAPWWKSRVCLWKSRCGCEAKLERPGSGRDQLGSWANGPNPADCAFYWPAGFFMSKLQAIMNRKASK